MRAIQILFGALTLILVLSYVVLFTSLNKTFLVPIIEGAISDNTKIKNVEFSRFDLSYDSLKLQLLLENQTINIDSAFDIMAKNIDLSYDVSIDDLSKFKKTDNGVLLLSIKSGGLGLNLENVDVAIFYEYWWTWVSYKQALDRIARITSENKNKIVYNLVTVPEIRFTGYELLSDDKVIDFACALLEKGFHSIDLWMSRKIIEKKKDLDSLLEGNESGKKEIVRALLQAYRQTEEKEKF